MVEMNQVGKLLGNFRETRCSRGERLEVSKWQREAGEGRRRKEERRRENEGEGEPEERLKVGEWLIH